MQYYYKSIGIEICKSGYKLIFQSLDWIYFVSLNKDIVYTKLWTVNFGNILVPIWALHKWNFTLASCKDFLLQLSDILNKGE